MSLHISAAKEQVAEKVIISGDPIRVKHMVNHFLEDAECVSENRGNLLFTGVFNGERVSMMGTGIGIPTTALYVTELLREYGVKTIIRAGTLGAIQPDLTIGEIVLAQAACTDSNTNRMTFNGLDFAPTASFDLLQAAHARIEQKKLNCHIGTIFSTDTFYAPKERWNTWTAHGVLGVEMESSSLYTLAAQHSAKALSVLTVSDNILNGQSSTQKQRESQFKAMFELALEVF